MSDYLLGADIGTTGVKTAVFNVSGELLTTATAEYQTDHAGPGLAEQNPEDWWTAFKETVRSVLSKTGIKADKIRAIGISAQSSTVLPLDKEGVPLTSAIIWMDSRGDEQRSFMQKTCKSLIEEVNPNSLESFYAVPKILWLKDTFPEIFQSTHTFIQANSYLVYRLTNELSMDISEAGLQHVYDLSKGKYSNELCAVLGIPTGKLPPVKACSEIVGKVHKAAADETGIYPGTPVVAGAVDTAAAALGTGVVADGQVFYSVGTSGNLCACSDRLIVDKVFFAYPHAIDKSWLFDMLIGAAGACLKWFRNELGGRENLAGSLLGADSYDLMNWQVSRSVENIHGPIFFPYMAGRRSPDWNDNARGVFFGLSLSTSRSQMIKAIMEGCAFELLHNLEALEQLGYKTSEVRLVGGVTKSNVWNQIWADVLNKRIVVPDTLGAPFGAAILAGKGVGIYKDMGEAATKMVKIKHSFEPDPSKRQQYKHLYKIYGRLAKNIDHEFSDLMNFKLKRE